MFYAMIIAFIIGYACIALEHPLQINKSATALLLGTIMWVLFIVGDPSGYPGSQRLRRALNAHFQHATLIKGLSLPFQKIKYNVV